MPDLLQPDNKYTLLPRSTGMQYALRALSPRVPDLYMLDATVVYPGIPAMGYGQSYYTMRSIMFMGVPPPRVHVHLKLYHVKRDVPIGVLPSDGREAEVTEQERVAFEDWMRGKFDEKDVEFERYYATGSVADTKKSHIIKGPRVENGNANVYSPREIALPLRLRSSWEILDAFAFPGPAAWAFFTGQQV